MADEDEDLSAIIDYWSNFLDPDDLGPHGEVMPMEEDQNP